MFLFCLTRNPFLNILVCIFVVTALGCESESKKFSEKHSFANRSYKDLIGREVVVPEKVQRIVLVRSFYVHELAIVLGQDLPKKLVGWDSSIRTGYLDTYEKYLEVFPELDNVAVLGDSLRGGLSVESIINLNPDLVILDKFMLDRGLQFLEPLEKSGLPLLYLSSDDPFSDPQRSIRLLGQVLGEEERANRAAALIDEEIERVQSRLRDLSTSKPTVYLEASGTVSEYGNTYGRNTSGWGRILEGVRCENVAIGKVPAMGKINPEQLLIADPEHILITGAYWTNSIGSLRLGYSADGNKAGLRLQEYCNRPGWNGLKAVKQKNVHGIHMRFVGHAIGFAGIQQISKWLYPKSFEDIHPEENLRRFHDLCLPVPYSGNWMTSLSNSSSR